MSAPPPTPTTTLTTPLIAAITAASMMTACVRSRTHMKTTVHFTDAGRTEREAHGLMGSSTRGVIESADASTVTVKSSGGSESVPRSQIASIDTPGHPWIGALGVVVGVGVAVYAFAGPLQCRGSGPCTGQATIGVLLGLGGIGLTGASSKYTLTSLSENSRIRSISDAGLGGSSSAPGAITLRVAPGLVAGAQSVGAGGWMSITW